MWWWRAAIIFFVFCAVHSAEAQTQRSVEAYGRLPAVIDAALSPDGQKIAMIATEGERGAFVVVDLQSNTLLASIAAEDGVVMRGVAWAADNYALMRTTTDLRALRSFRGRGARYADLREIDSWQGFHLEQRRLGFVTSRYGRVVGPVEGQANALLVMDRGRDAEYRVQRIDLRSGGIFDMSGVGGLFSRRDTIDYAIDRNGNVVARVDADAESNRWRIYIAEGGSTRLLLEGVSETGDPDVAPQGLLPDGRIAALAWDDRDEFVRLVAIERNGDLTTVAERDGFGIDGVITDPWTREVVGYAWTDQAQRQVFLDAGLAQVHDSLSRLFTNGRVNLRSWSRDRSRVLVYAELGLDGGVYYLYTPATAQLDRVRARYPELAQGAPFERQYITYRARDGVAVPAILTFPNVSERRNLPVVVLVHGGPANRDTMDFDWQAAFLASRGYVVLQPNFRGSSGYGATWEEAGRRQWGGLMQTDIEDGARALVAAGVADANRLCIVGGSYGGYAALAGAALTPDLYRCAVSLAGVTDLPRMLDDARRAFGAESGVLDYWSLSIGSRAEDREHLRSVSPVHMAERVHIPILLVHGDRDTTVPIAHARAMNDRLRDAGKNVRFVVLENEDHYLSHSATRAQYLRELETFLAARIGPGAP